MRIKLAAVVTVSIFLLASCASTIRTYDAASAGGAIGAGAGALIDRSNPWRGALIGGVLGGLFGGMVVELSYQASLEAARTGGKVVVYRGDERIEASPFAYDTQTNCHKIRERVWKSGVLVEDSIREVCEGRKAEPGY